MRTLGFIAARPRATIAAGIVKSAWSALFLIALLLGPFGVAGAAEYYGVDPGGSRYAELAQINTGNVDRLVTAWNYRTGDLARRDAAVLRHSKFEVTPILVDGRLLICTPFNEVIALDPGDGHELWRFDPKIATDYRPANLFTCRGVAFWRDSGGAAGPCATRVLTVTNDARLIALDLETGRRCAGFGQDGEVRIEPGKPLLWPGEWQMTSAPTVYADLVIVGSSIGDNQRVDEPRGTVRAFDVRTGALRWDWDPIPRRADDPAAVTWGEGWRQAGAANVWAPMSVDAARHLVFLPTTSPSPDFYGGLRPGDNLYADSVVALNADTGERVWSFQTVHHDVWDYDVASQPSLASITLDGKRRDVVIQSTKQGLIFVLDRETGQPVLPVEERKAPQGGVAGEVLSPTQPFPADLPPLGVDRVRPEDALWSDALGPRRLRQGDRRVPQRGSLHPAERAGNARNALHRRRHQLGWRRGRWRARPGLRQHLEHDPSDHAVSGGAVRRVQGAVSGQGDLAADRGAFRHDARGAAVADRPAVQPAAVGHAVGHRSQQPEDSMADAARHRRSDEPAGPGPPPRHADDRRAARHVGRAGLHRRRNGRLSSRIRRQDRRRALDRPPAGDRQFDADHL